MTGGLGYVGSHFVKTYLAANPQVSLVVVDNLSTGHQEALAGVSRVVFVEGDIGNFDQMHSVLLRFNVDIVVHFAASTLVADSQRDSFGYFDNNVIKSFSLFRAMEAAQVRKVVFSSSCAIYGYPRLALIKEEHPENPINVYGLTKLISEMTLRSLARTNGWSYIALRYFNAAGADESGLIGESHHPETHLIPLILQTALGKREFIEVFGTDYDTGDGTCVRDYVHVNDLAYAHLLALAKVASKTMSEAINLGTKQGISVLQAIDMAEAVTGCAVPRKVRPKREGDPPVLVADNQKAKECLGWSPKYSFRQMMETAWAWEQQRQY